jgi:U3 small nucleolar RNA-associated protein MPP10
MAGSSFSSTTSTSRTLSNDLPQPPLMDLSSLSASALVSALNASPHDFLVPSPALHAAALAQTKRYLDPLAASISEVQAQRLSHARKRKRKNGDLRVYEGALKLNKLYVEGFGVEQVWGQARRVLEAAVEEVEKDLPDVLGEEDSAEEINGKSDGPVKMLRFDEDGFEVDSAPSEEEADEDELDSNASDLEEEEEAELGFDDVDDVDSELEDIEDDDEGSEDDQTNGLNEDAEDYVEDPNGLNDGFFSIDDFNKQTEFLENEDAAGNPVDEVSDEEDIDWTANPQTIASLARARAEAGLRGPKGDDDEEESEDEDDGPTFGNADLNAPDDDSDVDMDSEGIDIMGGDNANEIKYADFFAPPPRKLTKGEKQQSYLKRQEKAKSGQKGAGGDDEDVQKTMESVRRELFDDEEEDISDSADDLEPLDRDDPKARRSTHERRQIKLAEEIRKLEAANVAKREWTLSGEARAADRPLNSLLEEDLDFERTGKPVPVITAEVSESIEDMIKARIIEGRFDELLRRRPDSVNTGVRRGRFELDDSKPQQSLAEIYEEEHLKTIDPSSHKDKADERTQKDHDEIVRLWADISSKLDGLSNWHYKPKPPKPSINIVADVATISMEDAQPTAAGNAGGMGGDSRLAPQEVYAPGKDKASVAGGEVVTKAGLPVRREEMSREEKIRRRRREKERIKKKIANKAPESEKKSGRENKKEMKSRVVGELKKGGVKVIGKGGALTDVEGRKVREGHGLSGAGGLKL